MDHQQGFVVGVSSRGRPIERTCDHCFVVDHGELVMELVAMGKARGADPFQALFQWVIASFHEPVFRPSDAATHTEALLNVIRGGRIDALGHLGNPNFDFDFENDFDFDFFNDFSFDFCVLKKMILILIFVFFKENNFHFDFDFCFFTQNDFDSDF